MVHPHDTGRGTRDTSNSQVLWKTVEVRLLRLIQQVARVQNRMVALRITNYISA